MADIDVTLQFEKVHNEIKSLRDRFDALFQQLKERHEDNKAKILEHHDFLFGNGKVGLDERFRVVETKLDTLIAQQNERKKDWKSTVTLLLSAVLNLIFALILWKVTAGG